MMSERMGIDKGCIEGFASRVTLIKQGAISRFFFGLWRTDLNLDWLKGASNCMRVWPTTQTPERIMQMQRCRTKLTRSLDMRTITAARSGKAQGTRRTRPPSSRRPIARIHGH